MREKAAHDQTAIVNTALEKQAIKLTLQFATKLLNKNRPIEEIIEYTGLSLEEIENLQK